MSARDDGEGRARSHRDSPADREAKDLTTQLAFLEEEVAMLRRKLADSQWTIRNIRGLGYLLEPGTS